jgi:hypothetical protein
MTITCGCSGPRPPPRRGRDTRRSGRRGHGRPGAALVVHAALAEEFAAPGSGRVAHFPGGYLKIGALLVPGVPWVCWKWSAGAPQSAGIGFDGLVRLGDRWVWFPKPWRAIGLRAAVAARHWTE